MHFGRHHILRRRKGEGKEKEKASMQSTLASLLMITACVALTCVVVEYATMTMEQTLHTSNLPQMERIRNLENTLLNQTDNLINSLSGNITALQPPNATQP
jgi:hypothetical protein